MISCLSHVFDHTVDARELAKHVELYGRRDAGCGATAENAANVPEFLDGDTKLFSEQFLRTHLSKQIAFSKEYGTTLSLLALADPNGAGLTSDERKQVAQLLLSGRFRGTTSRAPELRRPKPESPRRNSVGGGDC